MKRSVGSLPESEHSVQNYLQVEFCYRKNQRIIAQLPCASYISILVNRNLPKPAVNKVRIDYYFKLHLKIEFLFKSEHYIMYVTMMFSAAVIYLEIQASTHTSIFSNIVHASLYTTSTDTNSRMIFFFCFLPSTLLLLEMRYPSSLTA